MKQTTQLLLIILALIGALLPVMLNNFNEKQVRREFQQWTIKYAKQFKDQYQKAYRLQIFKQNKIKVEYHNKLADLGKYKYYMGLNQFASTTLLQYKHNYGTLKIGQAKSPNAITTKCKGNIPDTPQPKTQLSWKQTAVYDAVINQGKCSANWALSAVAALEGLYARQKGDKIKFSDQQLIDCSGDYGNEGCGGGFMDQAYWYIIDQGLTFNKSYPYKGTQQECKYNQLLRELSISQCARVPAENFQKLLSAINQQPVSVAIASQSFILYMTGIFDGECTTDLDRGMLLVGYGKEGDTEFWLLKNSVGAAWGQQGYIRLKKTAGNGPGLCGIQIAASVPQGLK